MEKLEAHGFIISTEQQNVVLERIEKAKLNPEIMRDWDEVEHLIL